MFGNKSITRNFIGNKNILPSHFGRKFSNTINKISDYAQPALGLASIIQPQFAPLLGTVGASLRGTQAFSNQLRGF